MVLCLCSKIQKSVEYEGLYLLILHGLVDVINWVFQSLKHLMCNRADCRQGLEYSSNHEVLFCLRDTQVRIHANDLSYVVETSYCCLLNQQHLMLHILSQNLYDFISPNFLVYFVMIENICYQLSPILLYALFLTHDELKRTVVDMLLHFRTQVSPVQCGLFMLGWFAANELSQCLENNLSQIHGLLWVHDELNASANKTHDVALLTLSYLLAALVSLYVIGAYVCLLEQHLHFLLWNLHNIKYNFYKWACICLSLPKPFRRLLKEKVLTLRP